MWEWLRKLTAGYTEEEYREYLREPEDRTNYLEIMQPDNSYLFVPKTQFEPVDKIPELGEVHSIKDIACRLAEVAIDTGYEPELLYELVAECVEDGNTYEEAFSHVAEVSYEHDWFW